MKLLLTTLVSALPLCAALGQGTFSFNTGGGQALVSELRNLALPSGTGNSLIQFSFGFATEELSAPDLILDSFSVTVQDAARRQTALFLTADASGTVFAPATPGTIAVDPASIDKASIAYPTLQPVLPHQQAFRVTAALPAALAGDSINVIFDLFDNQDAKRSQAWFSDLSVVQVPEPRITGWVVLAAFLGLVPRRKNKTSAKCPHRASAGRARYLFFWISASAVLLGATVGAFAAEQRSFSLAGTSVTLEDVSSDVDVFFTSMRLNRAANVWNVEVTVSNHRTRILSPPLVLSIEAFIGTTGPLQGDGQDASGKVFYDLSAGVSAAQLATGAKTQPRTLSLGVGNGAPKLTTKVFARSAPTGLALATTRTLNEVGQPLPDVQVIEVGPLGTRTNQTDAVFGVITLGQGTGAHTWQFGKPGYLSVWRQQTLGISDVAIVPNPRLVLRATNLFTVTPIAGGHITNDAATVQLDFPPGAVMQDTRISLTSLTPQTLPAFLPLGWSPLQAFTLELSAEPVRSASATLLLLDSVGKGESAFLVKWNAKTLTWDAEESMAGQGSSSMTTSLSGSGTYAVVVADAAPIAPPAPEVGKALAGNAASVGTFTNLTAVGQVNPSSSAASRVPAFVTATATLTISNQAGLLPSGLVLRSELREQYQLRGSAGSALPPAGLGTVRHPPEYENFFVAYQRPGDTKSSTLYASFPLRPLLLFGTEELDQATLTADILATSPFTGAVLDSGGGIVSSENVRVLAGTGDLLSRQVVEVRALSPTNFADFITNGMTVAAAFDLSIGGVAPGHALALDAGVLPTNSIFVLSRVLYDGARYGLEPVERLGSGANGRLSSREPLVGERLTGLNGAGQYVLLQVSASQGVVSGIARDGSGRPASGLQVTILGQPWLTVSDSIGAFKLVAPVGDLTLSVLDVVSGDTGTQLAHVASPDSPVNTTLASVASGPHVISVTPSDAARNVPRVSSIVVQFDKPINPASLATGGVSLSDPTNGVVSTSVALNLAGTVVTLLPISPLAANARHTIVVSTNITDLAGRPLEGPHVFTFTTESDVLNRVGGQLTAFAPTNGLARMVGSAGVAEANATVILLNETTGRTATVLAKADGSFDSSVEANPEDVLSAVLINGNGTRTTLPVGRVDLGDGGIMLFGGGGVITAKGELGDVAITVDPGAIPGAAVIRLDALSSNQVQILTSSVPPRGAKIVGQGFALSISGDKLQTAPHVSVPVDPAQIDLQPRQRPEDAVFALVAISRVGPHVAYCVADTMRYEDGHLKTSSPPFTGPDLQDIQAALRDRGLSIGALSSLLDTNQTVADFADEFEKVSMATSELNGKVAADLAANHPNAFQGAKTLGDAADFVQTIDPEVRLATDLFTLSYAAIQIAGARKVTVTGHVRACVADDQGHCTTNSVKRPVAGAVVSLHLLGSALSFRPGRIDEGFLYALSSQDGRYAILADNTALPIGSETNATGFLVTATHPRFFGQRPVEGISLSPTINTYPQDLTFADVDFNQPTKIPPFISASHTPAFPDTNQTAVLTIRATQGAQRPTVSAPVVISVSSLIPGADVKLTDVTITGPTNQTDVGDRTTQVQYLVKSSTAVNALLALQAASASSGVRQVGYEMVFSGASPPDPGNIQSADDHDTQPPNVVRTTPSKNGVLGTGQKIVIEFDEPIRREVVNQAAAVQLDPPAGVPQLSLSADQTQLEIGYPDLAPDTAYVLSLQSTITDLRGNALDATNPNAQLLFRTAPLVQGSLPGIVNGGGLVFQGAYAFALDRGSGDQNPPALLSYDLTQPDHPTLVQKVTLGVPFRDLALIPSYEFVTRTNQPVRTNTLLALIGGDFAPFFDDQGQIALSGQYLRIFDVTQPDKMALLASRRISASIGAATKIRWSPPLLAYLDSGADSQEIGLVNLQSFIIAANLTPDEFKQLPLDPTPGEDKNGDGDFVDPGEALPMPGQVPGSFAGKIGAFALDDTTQRIQDFSYDDPNGHLSVILGSGNRLDSAGKPAEALGPSFRTILSHGQIISSRNATNANFPITAGRPKRVFTLFNTSLVSSNGQARGDFALVSVVPDGSASFNGLIVLDITDPLSVRELGRIKVPVDEGLAQSVLQLNSGTLVLATSQNMLLLDPNKLLATNSTGGLHPAIVTKLAGPGSGSISPAVSDFGFFGSNLGTKQTLVEASPLITFAGNVDTNSVIDPSTFGQTPDAARDAFNHLRVVNDLVPATFRTIKTNDVPIVSSTLRPPRSQVHYHVLVFAPGSAGDKIQIALESLNASGYPLRNKGAGFPPVSAMDPQTRSTIGRVFRQGCDLTSSSLTAYRLSTNRLDPLFNVYLSKPFALLYESLQQSDLDQLRSELDRELLWSGHFLRASIDPAMASNPVLKPFASKTDDKEGVILPVGAALAQTLPADYIMGPNPPPVNGYAEVPRTMISAHNGEFRTTAVDFELPSRRLPIVFKRHIGGQDLYDGPFGRGWDFNYNQRLVELSGGVLVPGMKLPLVVRGNGKDEIGRAKDIFFQTGEGRTLVYTVATNRPPDEYKNDPLLQDLGWLDSAQDFYLPSEGVFDTLLRLRDGRFVRLEPDGTQFWYSPRGRLEKIQDKYPGNVVVLDYNDRGELHRVRDTSVTVDRFLKIGYYRNGTTLDADYPDKSAPNPASVGKICSLKDYTDREVTFEYDDCGHLIRKKDFKVSDGGSGGFTGQEITEYDYGTDSPVANDIRSVREGSTSGDPLFKAEAVDASAGAPVVQSGTGANGAYAFHLQQPNTAAALATGGGTSVSKPDSSQFQFDFLPDARLRKLTSSGSGTVPAAPTSIEYTNGLVAKVTYPEGNSVTHRYDFSGSNPLRSRPNILGILREPGLRPGDPTPEATYEYDKRFNFPSGAYRDFNGNQIVYSPSQDGRDIGKISYPGAGDITITYYDSGQLSKVKSIDGVETVRIYNQDDGFLQQEISGTLTTSYTYHNDAGPRGMPDSVTPPEGAPILRTYNERDEVLTEARPGTAYSRSLSYDINRNVIRLETSVDSGQTLVTTRSFLQNGFLRTNILEGVETFGGSQPLVTVYEPDAMFRIRSITYPGLEKRSYDGYDHLGNPHQMHLPGYAETYEYDLNGNLLSVQHDSATDHLHYDGYDRLIETDVQVDNGSEVTSRAYYPNGELLSLIIKEPSGDETFHQEYGIDSFGRNTSVSTRSTDQGDIPSGITYDGQSQKVTITNPVNEQTIITYNTAGQRLTQNNSTRQISFDYGQKLNLLSMTSAENGSQFLQKYTPYNALNQATAWSDSLAKIMDLEPRPDGAIKSTVNAIGHHTVFGLSKLGENLSRTREDGMTMNYQYDAHRAVAKVSDASNAGHSYTYDTSFRLQSTTYRDGSSSTANAFDPRNNLPTDSSIPGGHLTQGYDAKGRLTSRTVAFGGDSRSETFSYDALDRVRGATFPAGSRTFQFDKLGPVRESMLTVHGQQFETRVDIRPDGTRTTVHYPAPGVDVSEGRDPAGRLTFVLPSQGEPVVSSMVYASADRVGVHLLGGTNFLRSDSFFDPRKRLVARRYTLTKSGKVLADVRYAYDLADNLIARQFVHRSGRADLFGYDAGERLTRADAGAHPIIPASVTRTLAGFSPALNGWAPGFFGRDYTYNPGALDFLASATVANPDALSVPPFTTNFTGVGAFLDAKDTDGFSRTTDGLGNGTRVQLWVRPRSQAQPVPVGATLTYNGLSQLIRIVRDDGVKLTFDYEQDGLCCYRKVEDPALPGGVEETAFVYQHGLLLAEYDLTGGGNQLTARYYYAEDDVPAAADIAGDTGQLHRFYLMKENNGSVMGLVDSAGAVVERYFYDAWGQPEIQAPDVEPPVIDQIVAVPGGLLIQFSETVLPVLNDPGPPAFADQYQSLQNAITLSVDGRPVQGTLQYQESSPAGFGRTLAFAAGTSLAGTAATLTLAAGRVADEWGNSNLGQTVNFTINLTPGSTNFVRASRTATQPPALARSRIGNRFLFQGQYFEYDAGLIYMRARHYDPAAGQFLQRDPDQFKDSVNLFAGFGNNPTSSRDPSGRGVVGFLEKAGREFEEGMSVGQVRRAIQAAMKERTGLEELHEIKVMLGRNEENARRALDVLSIMRRNPELELVGTGSAGIIFRVRGNPNVAIKTFFSARSGVNSVWGAMRDFEGLERGFKIYDHIGWQRFYGASRVGNFGVPVVGGMLDVRIGRPAFAIGFQPRLLDVSSIHGLPRELEGVAAKELAGAETFARALGLRPADFQGGLVRIGPKRYALRVNDPFQVSADEYARAFKNLRELRLLGLRDEMIPGTRAHPGVIVP